MRLFLGPQVKLFCCQRHMNPPLHNAWQVLVSHSFVKCWSYSVLILLAPDFCHVFSDPWRVKENPPLHNTYGPAKDLWGSSLTHGEFFSKTYKPTHPHTGILISRNVKSFWNAYILRGARMNGKEEAPICSGLGQRQQTSQTQKYLASENKTDKSSIYFWQIYNMYLKCVCLYFMRQQI